MTNQHTTAALRSLLDILGGQEGYRGAVLDFLDYVDIAVPQAEPEARLMEMNFTAKEGEPFEASAKFQGDAVKEWSVAMVQWFREKGGINYVACDLSDPTTGERYEITMQKAGGRTPAQDLAEMRAALNRGDSRG